jgi:hypothetical protein
VNYELHVRREPAPEDAPTPASSEMSDAAEPETSVPTDASSDSAATTATAATIDTDAAAAVVDSAAAVSPVYASKTSVGLGDQEDELIADAAAKYFDPETNKASHSSFSIPCTIGLHTPVVCG